MQVIKPFCMKALWVGSTRRTTPPKDLDLGYSETTVNVGLLLFHEFNSSDVMIESTTFSSFSNAFVLFCMESIFAKLRSDEG